MPRRKKEWFDPAMAFEASEASLENAKSIMEESKALASKGKYGFAASLLVMALEEIGKALTLKLIDELSRHEKELEITELGARVERKVTTSVFQNHSVKKFIVFTVIPSLSVYQWWMEEGSQSSGPTKDELLSLMAGYKSFLERGAKEEGNKAGTDKDVNRNMIHQIMTQMILLAQKASEDYETIRLIGLYVDVRDGRLHTPSDISMNQYTPMHDYAIAAIPIAEKVILEGYPALILSTMHEWIQKYARVKG